MNTVIKEGYLYKCGKKSYQARRKKWFILTDSFLKYYSSSSEFNESNLLGTIPLVDVLSVAPSKGIKHGFEVIARTRSYYLAAKTGTERDGWIITLQRVYQDKRDKSTDVLNPKFDLTEFSKNKPDKSSKDNNDWFSESKRFRFSSIDSGNESDIIFKLRSISLRESDYDDNSMNSFVKTPVSFLNPAQSESSEGTIKGMYEELDSEITKCYSDEDEDDEVEALSTEGFKLPDPRDGPSYAFYIIKDLLKINCLENEIDILGETTSSLLECDKENGHAITLLKAFLEQHGNM